MVQIITECALKKVGKNCMWKSTGCILHNDKGIQTDTCRFLEFIELQLNK